MNLYYLNCTTMLQYLMQCAVHHEQLCASSLAWTKQVKDESATMY